MTNINAMYTSNQQDWETPHDLFYLLNLEFNFTLDVCADPLGRTAKCARYYSDQSDGLYQDWALHRDICWMNPPYSDSIPKWIAKAHAEGQRGATVVCLVPARTDTAWFWDHCVAGQIRFLKGRLKFLQNGIEQTSAPFPSALVIFAPHAAPNVAWWDWRIDPRLAAWRAQRPAVARSTRHRLKIAA